MKSLKIEEILGTGYERWANVTDCHSNIKMTVHFLEYDEYLDEGNSIIKRIKGDILKGRIKIDLVTKYKLLDNDQSGFIQSIKDSSNITAVAKVIEVEDSDTLICSINNLGKDVIVEFEDDIDIEIGKTLEISGSLELEIE